MDAGDIGGDANEVLRRLVSPFIEQGTKPVYVASCCGRLFAGEVAPVKCRVCGRPPESLAVESLEGLDISQVPDNKEKKDLKEQA